MRNQWLRLLLLRSQAQSQPLISQVTHLHSFTSSFLHPRAPRVIPKPFVSRHLCTSSSEPSSIDPPTPDETEITQLVDTFAKCENWNEETKLDFRCNNIIVTDDFVSTDYKNPALCLKVAKMGLNMVLNGASEKLSWQSYNWMLRILGSNGLVKECWDLIGVMKTKGCGVSKRAFVTMSDRFEKDGLVDDVEKLKGLYSSGSASCENSHKLDVELDDIDLVLTNIFQKEPTKALMFFRFVEINGSFKHDYLSYNAIATVLGREKYSSGMFWGIVHEMRSKGFEMERDTYVTVLRRFVYRKMVKDAVDLYEFAMAGENKPSYDDCIFLLNKILVSEELDMVDLFLKVVKIFKANGNLLTDDNLDLMSKYLTSVGRMNECYRILEAMEEGGYLPNGYSKRKIVGYRISKIIMSEVWGDDVEKQVKDLDVEFDSDLVVEVLKTIENEPNKALIFFSWVEESGLFKHDQFTFNSIATILSREESCEKFWRVVHEMRSKGYEMVRGIYIYVVEHFVERKMIKDAVDLYELAMVGENKPSFDDCIFLLKEIVVSKELDMVDLFLKVVKISKANGYLLSDANMDLMSKSLTSVGKVNECNKILEAMEEGGYLPNGYSKRKIIGSRIGKIIMSEVWGDDVEKQVKDLDVKFDSDLVVEVLMTIGNEPNKALIFFRWVEESGLFKHDQFTFNGIATILSREESCEKFWRVVHEMRSKGYEMVRGIYIYVVEHFVERKMIKDAVDLYEFAMVGENKPSLDDCVFLLKEIVISKELDMDLFLKVVKISKANGYLLSDANMDSILTSVGRINECNRILEAMEEGGYLPNGSSKRKIAFNLTSGAKTREAYEFMDKMAKSHLTSDSTICISSINRYCADPKLTETTDAFRSMVENEGPSCGGYAALDLLVDIYCQEGRPLDAYKLVSEMVNHKGLSPWKTTYKRLSNRLLVKGTFEQALDVMSMMKKQGPARFGLVC